MGDATTELLKHLNDPSRFERVVGVPVFRAHEREFPAQRLSDGRVIPARKVKVSEGDLYQICNRLNASIKSTGHLPPLTEGHRRFDPNFPEGAQPKILGFALNYRVDWVVRPEGERFLAILEDEFFFTDCRGALRQLPYRSLDYDADGRISEGTACLIRPPFFKLGTTCLYQAEGAAMGNEQWTQADEQAFQTFAKYMQRYNAMMGGAGPGNATLPAAVGPSPPPASPPPPAGYSATTPGVVYVTVGQDGRVIVPTVPPPVPYQTTFPAFPPPPPAAPVVPVAPPAAPLPPPPAAVAVPPVSPLPYSGAFYQAMPDGRLVQIPAVPAAAPAVPPTVPPPAAPFNPATYAAELAQVRQQLAVEQTARVTAECRSLLDPLVPVVTFDYSAELARLTGMADPNARAAHLKYMADHYGRLPGGSMIPVYSGTGHMPQPPQLGAAAPAPQHYQATLAYMNAHPGLSYDQAESAVLAKK